ncbi:MAG: internal scaffolding protein [Arizlama microvirus]|nr:MAG: internal scaffolding protein [Arizlama microvirus]
MSKVLAAVAAVPVIWRFAFDGLGDQVSAETGSVNDGESLAVQSGKDDADINVLVKRFGLGAEMPAARSVAQYGDFSGVVDYQTALGQLIEAEEAFNALPAVLRSRFRNDPQELFAFVHDERNLPEAVELGLVVPEAVVAPMKVEVVSPIVDTGKPPVAAA